MQTQQQPQCVLSKLYRPAGLCDFAKLASEEDRPQKWKMGRNEGMNLLVCVQGFAPAQPGSSGQVSSMLVY